MDLGLYLDRLRHLLQAIYWKESTANQELHQLGSFSKQESSVKNSWQETGIMASPIRLTVLLVTPDSQFWFVNPDQNTERLEDVLGGLGCRSKRTFSLNMTPKAITLSQPLISGHKSLTIVTTETELGNLFSGSPRLGTNKCSMSLLLVCTKCQRSKLSGSESRPMCDGRPFASSPFRRLASRGFFSSAASLLVSSSGGHPPLQMATLL